MTFRLLKFDRLFLLSILVLSVINVFSQDNLPELVKRIKPSAVAIETFDVKGGLLSRGSGFFISADKVITNNHVIEKSNRVEINLVNGKKYTVKGVLAVDGEGDLAVLQVDVPQGLAIPLPIEKHVPQEGESIVVIGNPYGLEGSVTNGIVSAVREISGYGKIIQITAPISPGSSGSPVVNMRGQVIGVATLQAAEGQSLNFAVPSERISGLKLNELKTFASLMAENQRNKRAIAERFYSQGLGILSRDDFTKAIPYFEKASEIDPNYAEAWYQLGFCFGSLNRHQDALKASRQAAKLRPEWVEVYLNIGASSYSLAQFRDALEAYRTALKINPDNAEAQYLIGLTFGKMNRNDEEILAYKRAIQIRPDHTNSLEKLGNAYLKQKKFAEAFKAFDTLKIYKQEARIYNNLGECLIELDKAQESIEPLNLALGVNPYYEKARYNLGRAYLKIGDRELAEMQYQILKNNRSDWADRLYILLNP
jgi:tetratricopeptide (TPR) repeat protein